MFELLIDFLWLASCLLVFFGVTFHRVNLQLSTLIFTLYAYVFFIFAQGHILLNLILWIIILILLLVNITPLRRSRLTKPLLNIYKRMVPKMSGTEKEALEAGGVWWEGQLFSVEADGTGLTKL